jgi:addiction module HigA family antidote
MSIARKPTDHGVAIHPGEFLREDFLTPMGLSSNALALALRVPVTRITEIVRERRGITADTALRLARYFGTTPDFWLKMQLSYDLALASSQAVRIYAEVMPADWGRKATERKMGEAAAMDSRSRRKRLMETV